MLKSTILSALLILAGCGLPQGSGTSAGVTYHRDVRPIIAERCGGCHSAGGIGGLVLDGSPVLTPLMMAKIEDGSMPPWPPGPLTPELVGERKLLAGELATLRRWADAGSPRGNQADYHPAVTPDAAQYNLTMRMSAPFHPTAGQSDQYRCFVLPGLPGGWITALEWMSGTPSAVHHVGGVTVDAAGLAVLRSRGMDAPGGWDCPADFGPTPAIAGLSATSASDPGFSLPDGMGIAAPVGGAIVVQVHYVPQSVGSAGDVTGVRLRIEQGSKRAVTEFQFVAPVEVPCALGVSSDPTNRCSRQYAFDHDGFRTPAQARADSDYALARCGQTLAGYYAKLPWQTSPQPSFLVPTDCTNAIPVSGDLLGVHLHMHTRGKSGRIELEQPDGTWKIVLDVPRWRWPWEQGYMLHTPIPVHVGQRVRVSCVIDNGTASQWGPAGPGHDGPAVPPLESQAHRIGGSTRGSEMCGAFLQIARKS